LLWLGLAGCSASKQIRILEDAPLGAAIARSEVEARIIGNISGIETLLTDAQGNLVGQGPAPRQATEERGTPPQAGNTPPKAEPGPAQWTEPITNGRFMAKRVANEPPKTRFVAEFPSYRSVFSLLSAGEKFWIRPPRPDGQVIAGTFDDTRPRTEGWPTVRPQDLGMLLLCDDIRPGGPPYISYMETWPHLYILHIIRPDRRPEIVYSRIWVERETLNVLYHQVFDADGTVVAEARMSDYRDVPVALSKGRAYKPGEKTSEMRQLVSLPRQVIIFWPKENLALELLLTHTRVNEKVDDQVFAPPDPTKAVILQMPSPAPGAAPK
jgi:hypothetical protein